MLEVDQDGMTEDASPGTSADISPSMPAANQAPELSSHVPPVAGTGECLGCVEFENHGGILVLVSSGAAVHGL